MSQQTTAPEANGQTPGTPNTQQPAAPNQQIKKFEESTVSSVLAKVESFKTEGNLQLPINYSPENAVRSAWLLIQQTKDLSKRPALEVCTSASIANALLDMVLQGLSPSKKQCYFVVMGNQLTMMRSYFGTIAISKRVAGVRDAVGVPIYENDVFKYSIDVKTGKKTVTQHDQDFGNIDVTKVKGAYAVITYEDGTIEYEVMTMPQIRSSWEMGNAKGNSPAHKSFADQMACRTVINRALKIPVNSSSDDDLFDENPDIRWKQIEKGVKLEIQEKGNGANGAEPIGFDEADPATDTSSAESGNVAEEVTEITTAENPVEEAAEVEQVEPKKAPF